MNGILNVYKEKGYTSHDVVAKLRGICHMKKIGHTGTLDPDAEGVLPVCLGTATKVCSLLTDQEKTYRAVLLLGQTTDTQDIGGKVLSRRPIETDIEKIKQTVFSFLGEYEQIPPMYSALKVNGKKLYELARAGIEVERKPRLVHILEIQIESIELPRIIMSVHCSKGTYIRTLCHDIGESLGCGGCMESLLRTRVGIFKLDAASKLEQIQKLSEESCLENILIPIEELFVQYPAFSIIKKYGERLRNGNRLPEAAFKSMDEISLPSIRVYDECGIFWGIYGHDEEKKDWKPLKLFGQR